MSITASKVDCARVLGVAARNGSLPNHFGLSYAYRVNTNSHAVASPDRRMPDCGELNELPLHVNVGRRSADGVMCAGMRASARRPARRAALFRRCRMQRRAGRGSARDGRPIYPVGNPRRPSRWWCASSKLSPARPETQTRRAHRAGIGFEIAVNFSAIRVREGAAGGG